MLAPEMRTVWLSMSCPLTASDGRQLAYDGRSFASSLFIRKDGAHGRTHRPRPAVGGPRPSPARAEAVPVAGPDRRRGDRPGRRGRAGEPLDAASGRTAGLREDGAVPLRPRQVRTGRAHGRRRPRRPAGAPVADVADVADGAGPRILRTAAENRSPTVGDDH